MALTCTSRSIAHQRRVRAIGSIIYAHAKHKTADYSRWLKHRDTPPTGLGSILCTHIWDRVGRSDREAARLRALEA
jgi:hypothetical protein